MIRNRIQEDQLAGHAVLQERDKDLTLKNSKESRTQIKKKVLLEAKRIRRGTDFEFTCAKSLKSCLTLCDPMVL